MHLIFVHLMLSHLFVYLYLFSFRCIYNTTVFGKCQQKNDKKMHKFI